MRWQRNYDDNKIYYFCYLILSNSQRVFCGILSFFPSFLSAPLLHYFIRIHKFLDAILGEFLLIKPIYQCIQYMLELQSSHKVKWMIDDIFINKLLFEEA